MNNIIFSNDFAVDSSITSKLADKSFKARRKEVMRRKYNMAMQIAKKIRFKKLAMLPAINGGDIQGTITRYRATIYVFTPSELKEFLQTCSKAAVGSIETKGCVDYVVEK